MTNIPKQITVLLNNSKKYIIGFLIGSIFFGTISFAAGGGTIGDLFYLISGTENGTTVTDVYRLDGTNIEDGTITIDELKSSSVGSSEVIDNSLTANDLATNSVGSSEVANNSLTANDLAANSVGSSEVVNNSLTTNDLAANSVGNSEMIDNPTFTNTLVKGKTYIGSIDSYFYSDSANRIATPDSFYIQSSSPGTYLYSTNTYLGNSSGDTTHLRGNDFTWNQGVIQGDGNVGIGTTNPSQKLDVNGKIRMRSQTLSSDSSDIVATKGYVDSNSGSNFYTASAYVFLSSTSSNGEFNSEECKAASSNGKVIGSYMCTARQLINIPSDAKFSHCSLSNVEFTDTEPRFGIIGSLQKQSCSIVGSGSNKYVYASFRFKAGQLDEYDRVGCRVSCFYVK